MRTDSTSLSEAAVGGASQARSSTARLRPGEAAPVRAQGEERARGSRGDSPRRRPFPHAERGPRRAVARRVRALRPDLEAHDLVADGGRAWPDRLAPDRGDVSAGETVEFGAAGTVITFPGFLAAYEVGRDDVEELTDQMPLPKLNEGDALDARSSRRVTRRRRRRGTRRRRSCARSRTSASAGRRRTRRSSARSSTAATSSSAAPRSCRRSSRSPSSSCSSSTSHGSSTTASPPAWRTTSTGSRPASRSGSTGCARSTTATTAPRVSKHS